LSLSLFQKVASPAEKFDWIEWLPSGQLGELCSHPSLSLNSSIAAEDQQSLEQAERDKASHEMHPWAGCYGDLYACVQMVDVIPREMRRKNKIHFPSPLYASLAGGQ
jgi:hypothetical protein